MQQLIARYDIVSWPVRIKRKDERTIRKDMHEAASHMSKLLPVEGHHLFDKRPVYLALIVTNPILFPGLAVNRRHHFPLRSSNDGNLLVSCEGEKRDVIVRQLLAMQT